MDIKNKEFLLGSWINTVNPIVAEIMSNCGFDFLVVDAEHSYADFQTSQQIFQAIKAGNPDCVPMIRLPNNDYAITKKFLDLGAIGVIAPFICNGEQTKYLVDSVKYPPTGNRGFGYVRSNGYGFDLENYINKANEDTFICVQIEHKAALDNLDEIFSVKGVDAMIIGPYDLSASLGITAQFNHQLFIETTQLILKKAKEYGILPGIHIVQPNTEEVLNRIDEGYKFISYTLDITLIGTYFRQDIRRIRENVR